MNSQAREPIATSASDEPALDVARYGPDGPTERTLRLLGDLKGKRVLELGSGAGQSAIAFAKQGATAIAVDPTSEQVTRGRRLAEREEVKVEWHESDLAELAFLRADSVDLVFSAYAFSAIEDLGRVFRQVHRVLRQHAMFVFSYEHPFATCIGRDTDVAPPSASGTQALPLGNLVVRRSYFDEEPLHIGRDDHAVTLHPRSIGDVFAALGRAGFRVDSIVETMPDTPASPGTVAIPETIVWRARKEGV